MFHAPVGSPPLAGLRVLHVVLNDFAPDVRVLKEAASLVEAGADVTLFALWDGQRPREETVDGIVVRRFALAFRSVKGAKWALLAKYLDCLRQMRAAAIAHKPDVIHVHDLSALPIGWMVAGALGCRFIYDSHELWADSTHNSIVPGWVFARVAAAERAMARRADRVITVSDGIADVLARSMGIARPLVVRNVPPASADAGRLRSGVLRQALGLPEDAFVFLYVGGVMGNRGVDLLLDAFAALDRPDAHLVFLGTRAMPPGLGGGLSQAAGSRVHFQPPVPFKDVAVWASDGDVGIHPIRDSSLSHRLCLPNKLFEYIQARLPVIVTDLPEMGRFVRDYGLGRLFPDGDGAALRDAMAAMMDDRGTLAAMRRGSEEAAATLVWENERQRVIDLYQALVAHA